MSMKQLSIFLENRTGQLAEITSVLAQNNIDLRALHISETADYGVLRLITSEWERAKQILTEDNVLVSISDVVTVSVPDRPGGLSSLVKVLSDNNISVSYMYSVFGKTNGGANMVFKVQDVEAVEKILTDNGYKTDTID